MKKTGKVKKRRYNDSKTGPMPDWKRWKAGIMSEDNMLTRVTLIGKAKDQNDDRAWAEFTAYYRKYIYNLVRRIGLNHHDADEVVQITLVKIWNAMPEFQYKPEKGRFRSWICCIAGNAAKNFIRAQGPSHISLSAIDWGSDDSEEVTIRPEVEALAEQEWERYLPELALKNISGNFDRKTLQVFAMCRQGIPVPEIAAKLGLAESSIYVYKQRVKQRLAEEVERLKEEL